MAKKRREMSEVVEQEIPRDGDLEVRARGKEAKRLMSQQLQTHESTEDALPADKTESIIKLLQDPKNLYTVRRTYPKVYENQNIAFEVTRGECPITLEDLKREVFETHGGHKFQIRIQDDQGRVKDAIVITNPDTDQPILRVEEVDPTFDPTAEEIKPDAIEAMEQEIDQQLRLQQKRASLQEKRKLLEDLRGDGSGKRNGTSEVTELKKQIDDLKNMIVENSKDVEIRRLREELERNKSGAQQNPEIAAIKEQMNRLEQMIVNGGGKKEDGLMLKLFDMVKDMNKNSSDAIASALRDLKTTVAPTDKSEDLDSLLEKLVKLQGITGNKTENKLDQIQELILDTALRKFMGTDKGEDTDPGEPEDFGKFALRELMPVIKDLTRGVVEEKRKGDGRQPTRQEIEAIIAQQAQIVAADIVRRQQMGQLPTGRPAPAPQPQPHQPPTGPTGVPVVAPQTVIQQPATTLPQFDRKQAVNYVLNTLQGELAEGKKKGQYPEESYAAGDALDTWPDDLLDMMLDVGSGEELKAALAPHADPVLLDGIINATKDDKAARKWLQDIFLGLRQEWEEEKKATGRGRPLEGPDAPPAEKF